MYTVLKGGRVQDLELATAPSKEMVITSTALTNNQNRHDICLIHKDWLEGLAVEDDGEDEIRLVIADMTAEAAGDRPTASTVHERLQIETAKEGKFCGPGCWTRRRSDSSDICLDILSLGTDITDKPSSMAKPATANWNQRLDQGLSQDTGVPSDSGYGSMPAIAKETDPSKQSKGSLEDSSSYDPEHLEDEMFLAEESRIGSIGSTMFDLLLSWIKDDPVLNPLFFEAMEKKGFEKAISSLEEFIKGYCLLLRVSNPDANQSRVIVFLLHRVRAVARAIFVPQQSEDEDAKLKAKEHRNLGIKAVASYLESLAPPHTDLEPRAEVENVDLKSDDGTEVMSTRSNESIQIDGSGRSSLGWPTFPENVLAFKEFFVQGEPMRLFRRHYRHFVNGERLDNWNQQVRREIERHLARQTAGSTSFSAESSDQLPSRLGIHGEDVEENVTSAVNLFIQDPQSYFETVDAMQRRVFDLGRTAIGEIEQGDVTHVLPLPASPYMAPSNALEVLECLQLSLERDLEIIFAILEGIRILAEARFCEAIYNIIVNDSQRLDVLKVIPITQQSLNILQALIGDAIYYCSELSRWPQAKKSIQDIGESAALILHHLDLTITPLDSEQNNEYQQCLNSCRLLSVTSSVLFFGLVSFVKSHLSVPYTDLVPLTQLQIQTLNEPIIMAPKRLACLDRLVKHPVWVFSRSTTPFVNSNAQPDISEGFQLSTTIADFADLWGPVSLEYDEEDVTRIKVRNGEIRRKDASSSSTSLGEEVPCHWYDSIEDSSEDNTGQLFPIHISSLLLIGCSRDNLQVPTFSTLIHSPCECGYEYASNYGSFELKTRESSWKVNLKNGQITAGKIVTLTYGHTYKFDAGWTLKDVIVEDWMRLVERNLDCPPEPFYLDYRVILEISYCSGHSQRMTLWELIKSHTVDAYVEAIADKECKACFNKLLNKYSTYRLFSEAWRQFPDQADRIILRRLVNLLLDKLRSTGVGRDGWLQAWDVTSVSCINGRKLDPSWRTILRDDPGCATFAIITNRCIKPTPRLAPSEATMLCTKICVTWQHAVKARTSRTEIGPSTDFTRYQTRPSRDPTFLANGHRLTALNDARERYAPDLSSMSHRVRLQSSANPRAYANPPLQRRQTLQTRYEHNDDFEINSNDHPEPWKENLEKICFNDRLPYRNHKGHLVGILKLECCQEFLCDLSRDLDINISSRSIPATWEAQGPGNALMSKTTAMTEKWDTAATNWTKRNVSSSVLPWLLGEDSSDERPDAYASEYIRPEIPASNQKVLSTHIR